MGWRSGGVGNHGADTMIKIEVMPRGYTSFSFFWKSEYGRAVLWVGRLWIVWPDKPRCAAFEQMSPIETGENNES